MQNLQNTNTSVNFRQENIQKESTVNFYAASAQQFNPNNNTNTVIMFMKIKMRNFH